MILDLPYCAANQYTFDAIEAAQFANQVPSRPIQSTAVARVDTVLAQQLISAFEDLEQDWDGYGAVPIHSETSKNATAATEGLAGVLTFADIYPNPNGTISFEWESKLGRACLEIGRTKYSFYVKPTTGIPIYADGKASHIDAALGQLVSSCLFPMQTVSRAITNILIDAPELFDSYSYC
jgi:hypothetical protein